MGFNVFESNFWRDVYIFAAYVVFNFVFIYACSWFYLQGYGQIKSFFSGASAQEKKAKERRADEYV